MKKIDTDDGMAVVVGYAQREGDGSWHVVVGIGDKINDDFLVAALADDAAAQLSKTVEDALRKVRALNKGTAKP